MPFVQGTSYFKLFTVKEHWNSGTYNVSVALWWFGGRVTSVICTLLVNVQDGIMALFHIVYKIVQRYAPLTGLEGDAWLIPLTGGTIIPSYHSRPTDQDICSFLLSRSVPLRVTPLRVVSFCDCLLILAPTVRPRRRSFVMSGRWCIQ